MKVKIFESFSRIELENELKETYNRKKEKIE